MKTIVTTSGYKIHQVLGGRSNVFLLTNGKSNVLVDTSPAYRWKALVRRLKDLSADHIDLLILTHSHFDHTGNASVIRSVFNCPVLIHKDEAVNLRSGEMTIPKGTNRLTSLLVNFIFRLFSGMIKTTPCQPDITVNSEYDLGYAGFRARILHTPGHSPGSSCLLIDDEIAIAGDTVFGVFRRTAYPPFADDETRLLESWARLLETNCRTFLPSHGLSKSRDQMKTEFEKRKIRAQQ